MKNLTFLLKQATLFSLFALLLPFVLMNAAAATELTPVIGHVIWIKGTLKAQLPGADARSLKRQSNLYEHDTITSGPASQGKIVFTNHSILRISENSTIKIDQYYHTKETPSMMGNFIKRLMGSIRDIFRTITGFIENKIDEKQ